MTSFYMKCNSGLKCFNSQDLHCVKYVCIRSFSGPYLLAFGLNTERYSVFSRIGTEYGEKLYLSVFSPNAGKYGPEKPPYLDTFQNLFEYNH